MKAFENAKCRLQLAEGFLGEAEQDATLARWRSCVDNAQMSVENAGKTVLALYGVTPKTHDPAQPIAVLLRNQQISGRAETLVQQMLPDLLALGSAEHFLTDYGDEATGTLPWELFTQESAEEALASARHSVLLARELLTFVIGPGEQ